MFRWQNAEDEFLNKKNYAREVRLDSSQLFLASAELQMFLVAVDDSHRAEPGQAWKDVSPLPACCMVAGFFIGVLLHQYSSKGQGREVAASSRRK